ncbi:MAG: TauD/TfdA family dioxygenase, partial [Clostridia bacterium]|nr:TauD/TfdA family dioxygenase [Clostridia bacterium]
MVVEEGVDHLECRRFERADADGVDIGLRDLPLREVAELFDLGDEGAHVGRTYGQTKDSKGSTFLSSYARTLTNGGLRFHTDRTDVVGLLCVRQAMKGGVSTLASTPAIHHAMLAKRPDLLDALFTAYWR